MELVIAENHHFSSRLCTGDCGEHLSQPCDDALCGISVHQSRHALSTDVGIVAKCNEYVADTRGQFNTSATSEHTHTAESLSSVANGEVVRLVSPAGSYTDANVIDSCIAEDSQSSCTNDCALSVSAVTAKLADSNIAETECISRPKSLCTAVKTVWFPVDGTDSVADQHAADDGNGVAKLESKRMSLLLRLFESKLFDMAIALPYLFNSKEPGVLAYLGQLF